MIPIKIVGLRKKNIMENLCHAKYFFDFLGWSAFIPIGPFEGYVITFLVDREGAVVWLNVCMSRRVWPGRMLSYYYYHDVEPLIKSRLHFVSYLEPNHCGQETAHHQTRHDLYNCSNTQSWSEVLQTIKPRRRQSAGIFHLSHWLTF